MTLKDLYDWIWFGEGFWILNGFIQAWALMDHRQNQDEIPHLADPPNDGQGSWHGGPCYPLGEFEDTHDILRELGLSPQ